MLHFKCNKHDSVTKKKKKKTITGLKMAVIIMIVSRAGNKLFSVEVLFASFKTLQEMKLASDEKSLILKKRNPWLPQSPALRPHPPVERTLIVRFQGRFGLTRLRWLV